MSNAAAKVKTFKYFVFILLKRRRYMSNAANISKHNTVKNRHQVPEVSTYE